MKNDPGIQWIRDVRVVLSNELANDPERFVAFYKKRQDDRKDKTQKQTAIAREEGGQYNSGDRQGSF